MYRSDYNGMTATLVAIGVAAAVAVVIGVLLWP